MKPLEQVLADAREDAAVLKRHGQAELARAMTRLCDDVAEAAEDYLTFVSEADARLRSNRSIKWLRSQFAAWEAQGHARMKGGHRQYRLLILPQRANPHAAYEAGKSRGRGAAA